MWRGRTRRRRRGEEGTDEVEQENKKNDDKYEGKRKKKRGEKGKKRGAQQRITERSAGHVSGSQELEIRSSTVADRLEAEQWRTWPLEAVHRRHL